MREINGYSIEDMRQFDTWAKQPKKPVQKMSKQERSKKYSQYQWRLAQRSTGGSDTVPTSAYPKQNRQNAQVEGRRTGVTLKESTQWRETTGSSSWKDSEWKESPWKNRDVWETSSKVKEEPSEKEPKQTPGSSSTSWQQDSWHQSSWQQDTPPWRKDENKQKRRKP